MSSAGVATASAVSSLASVFRPTSSSILNAVIATTPPHGLPPIGGVVSASIAARHAQCLAKLKRVKLLLQSKKASSGAFARHRQLLASHRASTKAHMHSDQPTTKAVNAIHLLPPDATLADADLAVKGLLPTPMPGSDVLMTSEAEPDHEDADLLDLPSLDFTPRSASTSPAAASSEDAVDEPSLPEPDAEPDIVKALHDKCSPDLDTAKRADLNALFKKYQDGYKLFSFGEL
jgi:hypothetical protein